MTRRGLFILTMVLLAVASGGIGFLLLPRGDLAASPAVEESICDKLFQEQDFMLDPVVPPDRRSSVWNCAAPVAVKLGGRTFDLPVDWTGYMPSAWQAPRNLRMSVEQGVFRFRGREVLLIDSVVRKRQDFLLIRIRAQGSGSVAPFIRAFNASYIREYEIHPPLQRVSSWFRPRDLWFVVHPDEKECPLMNLGLAVKGRVAISDVELLTPEDARTRGGSSLIVTVNSVSEFPEPAKSSYPDCLYAVEATGYVIISGKSVPRRFILLADAFRNRQLAKSGSLKPGDRLRIWVRPFAACDAKDRSIQQADTLDLFELERYRLLKMRPQRSLMSEFGNIPFAEDYHEYRSPFDHPVNPSPSPALKAARQKKIAENKKRFDAMFQQLETHSKTWSDAFDRSWTARSKELTPRPNNKVWGRGGKGFFALKLGHKLLRPSPVLAANYDALKSLEAFMECHGVQLIVALAPDSDDVAARLLNPTFASVPDCYGVEAGRTLSELGIECIYGFDELVKKAANEPFSFLYPDDWHPAQGFQEVMTTLTAERLRERFGDTLKPRANASDFAYGPAAYVGNVPFSVDGRNAVPCRPVFFRGAPYGVNPTNSEVLVIGNSFLDTPFPKGMSFSSLLAMKSGVLPQDFMLTGAGPIYAILLELFNSPEIYLKGKKVCILLVHPAYFASYRMLDLREIDRQNRMLSGKKPLGDLTLPKDSKQGQDTQWDVSLAPFEKTTRLVRVELIPEKDSAYQVDINGRAFTLTPVPRVTGPLRLLVPVDAGTRSLRIRAKRTLGRGEVPLKIARMTAYQ